MAGVKQTASAEQIKNGYEVINKGVEMGNCGPAQSAEEAYKETRSAKTAWVNRNTAERKGGY